MVIFRFWGYFGHFLGFSGILVIFYVSVGILVIFWFRMYFGHFMGFGGILVIFWIPRGIWSFSVTTKITNSKTKKNSSPTNKFYPKQTTWPFKKILAK